MERSCLPKEERLCGAQRIRMLLKNGVRYSCDGAKLFVLPNKLPYNRFICTFKRHYGCAVLLLFPGKDSFLLRTQQLESLFKKADMFSIRSQYYETQISEKN